MTYNIHPLFVHFPIALLCLYSVIKILPLYRLAPRIAWRDVERILLLVGVIGAVLASMTGEIAEHLVRANHDLVELHALFAGISTWLYGALLLGEILRIANVKLVIRYPQLWLLRFSIWLERLLTHRAFSIVLALLALVAVIVTGILGGALVYGKTADPIAPFIIGLFGVTP